MKLVGIEGTQCRPRLSLVEDFSAQVAFARDGIAWLGAIGCKWKELIRGRFPVHFTLFSSQCTCQG